MNYLSTRGNEYHEGTNATLRFQGFRASHKIGPDEQGREPEDSNSVSFLRYYIGNGKGTIDQFEFAQLLKHEILQTIKSKLVSYILESDEEIIGISRKQTALAEEIRKDIEDAYSQKRINELN